VQEQEPAARKQMLPPDQTEPDAPQRPAEPNPFELDGDVAPVPKTRPSPVRTADFTPETDAREIRPIGGEEQPRTASISAATTQLPEAVRLREAQALIDEGDDIEAHKLLSKWYFEYPTARPAFQKSLDELSDRLFFQPQPFYHPPYVVQSGDLLQKIAAKHKLSWQYLSRVNKVDPKKIRAGQKLKVMQGPFAAVVDLSDFELTIHCRNRYVRKYRIGTGKGQSTPIGEFVVKEKLENPKYWGPNGDVREADDPLNPLGERWIDIGDGFGIHGTIEPDSIGKCESRGCIRLLNADVAEVYDLLVVGSTVRIQK
jgi:LysM repeat protein